MRTRLWIGLTCLAAVVIAAVMKDLAACYVAIGAAAIVYLLHAIEFKLDRLLDRHDVRVSDFEIARD